MSYEYYEYDNTPVRVLRERMHPLTITAEGYFPEIGFSAVSVSLVFHEGRQISEQEFKQYVIRLRNSRRKRP